MDEVELDNLGAELAVAFEEHRRRLEAAEELCRQQEERSRHVPRCETCRHYVPHISSENLTLDRGTCRRFPPSRTFGALHGFEFPPTIPRSWCGEHQPAEPQTADQAAEALARATLAGDKTAARALADRLIELDSPQS